MNDVVTDVRIHSRTQTDRHKTHIHKTHTHTHTYIYMHIIIIMHTHTHLLHVSKPRDVNGFLNANTHFQKSSRNLARSTAHCPYTHVVGKELNIYVQKHGNE